MAVSALVMVAAACAGSSEPGATAPPPQVPTPLPASTPTDPAEVPPTQTPASTPVGTPDGGEPSTTDDSTFYASIRDVDFMTGFTYYTGVDYAPTATVFGGLYETGEVGGADDYFWFGVSEVEFADLDADGADEAIVSTWWNGGGSGFFHTVVAYRLVGGALGGTVEEAGRVQFGDRGDGGIYDVRIDDGVVSVWSFSTTLGACCPNEITENRLVLGEHALVVGDRGTTRRWVALTPGGEELEFLLGTSSAVLALDGRELDGSFTFEAARDQRLSIRVVDGPAPDDISVTVVATGETISGFDDIVLPADGFYEVDVTFDAKRVDRTTLEVAIDGEPAASVSWTPRVEQVVVSEEPAAYTSLVWPEFASSQPGTEAANPALAAFVETLDDYWIEDVTEFSEPQDDSSYELSFHVTLVADDLVSVRFDFYDYVCCRPYPNYGSRGAIVDLAAGRLIAANEILDLTQIDEINEIWITELEKQGLGPTTVAELVAGQPQFDSLMLVPGGVEFGTDRSSLGGGMPGTMTFVGFDQLGDLIDPAIVARTTAG